MSCFQEIVFFLNNRFCASALSESDLKSKDLRMDDNLGLSTLTHDLGWASASPDELVKDGGAVGCLAQNHGAVVAREQQLLEHVTLHGQHQAVGLDHLHLVRADGLHAQRDVAAVAQGQQGLHALHQAQGVVEHRGPAVQRQLLLQGCCGAISRRFLIRDTMIIISEPEK